MERRFDQEAWAVEECMGGEFDFFDAGSWPADLGAESRCPANSFGRRSSGAGATAVVRILGSCSVIRGWPAGPGSPLAAPSSRLGTGTSARQSRVSPRPVSASGHKPGPSCFKTSPSPSSFLPLRLALSPSTHLIPAQRHLLPLLSMPVVALGFARHRGLPSDL